MEKMGKRVEPRCIKCGSRNVTRDANAAWDTELQRWVLGGTMDTMGCENCGSTDTVWVTAQEDLLVPWEAEEQSESDLRFADITDTQGGHVARVYGDGVRAHQVTRLLTLAPLLLGDAKEVAEYLDSKDAVPQKLQVLIATLRNRIHEIEGD